VPGRTSLQHGATSEPGPIPTAAARAEDGRLGHHDGQPQGPEGLPAEGVGARSSGQQAAGRKACSARPSDSVTAVNGEGIVAGKEMVRHGY